LIRSLDILFCIGLTVVFIATAMFKWNVIYPLVDRRFPRGRSKKANQRTRSGSPPPADRPTAMNKLSRLPIRAKVVVARLFWAER
jgi:hypothetical protein